ncbi:hypothetical protein [Actinomadura fibrosa]|uniref:Uncharacterized protein n=1 Tax=Actinomadura fibrosa TaxID=111802 RepID=A0ABW2XLH8_9ACTN|nr:hypothetical protein [Actinomadura fibrosa]
MSDDHRTDGPEPARWRKLPVRTPLEDLTTGHEVPPTPQAIADTKPTPLDEATRYPI